MSLSQSFVSVDETSLGDEFQSQGYVIRDVEDRKALDALRGEIVRAAARLLELPVPKDDGEFLDAIHRTVRVDKLNAFRLGMYRELNAQAWFRPTYFHLGRGLIETLVGNASVVRLRHWY